MSDLHASVLDQLLGLIEPGRRPGSSLPNLLLAALRLLAKWRSQLIQNTVLAREGVIVSGGPFQGMRFLARSAEGCHIPKLLGCYEQPLHPFVRAIDDGDYQTLLNIGCAEGYYAIGMARRLPGLRVFAFDSDSAAREATLRLAGENQVLGRLNVAGLFESADVERYASGNTLVICDIEGAEADLMDPRLAPALRGCDLLIEVHECFRPGLLDLLRERFEATHIIRIVKDLGHRQVENPPDWFGSLPHLDQLLATWEWRAGPTPWMILQRRSAAEPSPVQS